LSIGAGESVLAGECWEKSSECSPTDCLTGIHEDGCLLAGYPLAESCGSKLGLTKYALPPPKDGSDVLPVDLIALR